jgi:hypothetical protein
MRQTSISDSMLKSPGNSRCAFANTDSKTAHEQWCITDAEIVERILDGRLVGDAISRSCEILKQYEPPPPPEGNGS